MKEFNEISADVTRQDNIARDSMDLRGLLQRCNDPEQDRINMDL